jgi:hypothetical protein
MHSSQLRALTYFRQFLAAVPIRRTPDAFRTEPQQSGVEISQLGQLLA